MVQHIYSLVAQAQTQTCSNVSDCKISLNLPKVDASQDTLSNLLKIVFGITVTLSIIYITYSGFKYVTAQGDPNSLTKARNGIIYGVIGLVISLSAFAIVGFTIGRVAS